jgi:hypothetical protein
MSGVEKFVSVRTLDAKLADMLGNVDLTTQYEHEVIGWTHVLVQVAHVEQSIRVDLANCLIISTHPSERAALAERERIKRVGVVGEILVIDRSKTPMLVLARFYERMRSKYQNNKRKQLNNYFVQDKINQIQNFQQDSREREEGKAAGLEKTMAELRAKAVVEGKNPDDVKQPEFWKWEDEKAMASKQAREEAYHKAYDSQPWIQWFRNEFLIHPSVTVKPNACSNAVKETLATYRVMAETGFHVRENEELPDEEREKLSLKFAEASTWATDKMRELERVRDASRARKSISKKKNDTEEQEDDDDVIIGEGAAPLSEEEIATAEADARGNAPFPDAAKRSRQNFTVCSIILDPTKEMEPGVYIYGCFDTFERAREVANILRGGLEPLFVNIIENYRWFCPYMMEWKKNSEETQGIEMESGSSDRRFQDLNKSRKEQFLENNKRLDALNARDTNMEQIGDRVLRILGITQNDWNAAVTRHGESNVYAKLVSLPSIAPIVEQFQAINGSTAMMNDIFTPTRVLTAEDKVISDEFFKQKNYSLAESNALLESIMFSS